LYRFAWLVFVLKGVQQFARSSHTVKSLITKTFLIHFHSRFSCSSINPE